MSPQPSPAPQTEILISLTDSESALLCALMISLCNLKSLPGPNQDRIDALALKLVRAVAGQIVGGEEPVQ